MKDKILIFNIIGIIIMILIGSAFQSKVFANQSEFLGENLIVNEKIDENTVKESDINSNQLMTFSLARSSITQNIEDIAFEHTDAYDVMIQYVMKNNTETKILNNNILYSCDISTGTVITEYTFPEAEYSTTAGIYASQSRVKAYIDEEKGLLYYGYNSYYNTYSDDEIINIIVYDLENSKVLNTFQVSGYILHSLGTDKNGNIYIGTDDYFKSEEGMTEGSSIIILSSAGKIICQKTIDYPINSFSGFCDDGTFYYIDEYMEYSAYGYENLMGRLKKASFASNKLTLNDKYIDYVKNIYFGDYTTPVEILNNKYLVTFNGLIIPLNDITEDSYKEKLYAVKELEMGGKYDYIYNVGVNCIINGDNVYTLYDNDTIFVYSLSTGKKVKFYNTSKKIFNMKECGENIVLLETDGESFYYEKISKSNFKTITTTVYNMNNFSVYKGRTKNDIINKFSKAVPNNYSPTLYATIGSEKSPYKESTLTSGTKANALNLSNYYRWLAGLTTLSSASSDTWNNAAKGAVLLASSEFSHTPAQPSDMSDSFYEAAYKGTSTSNIATGGAANQYRLISVIRAFMNDTGYTVPGHRNNFLTRNATNIAYGISSNYLCQTVEYEGTANPLGTAVIDNNQAAYAWPSAGYFPAEELSKSAYWTVNLNTDKLELSNISLQVTIQDLDTGEIYKRTSSSNGLYSTSYWGKFICFAPPEITENSYAGKRYKITLTNLTDVNGLPAKLEYTVNFFSYKGTYTFNGVKYNCNEYGQLVKIKNISSMKAKLSYTSKAYTGNKLKPTVTISGLKNGTDYTVKYSNNINPGKATVIITGKGNYTGKITKTFIIKPAQVKNPKVTAQSTDAVAISWSKVVGVTGYKVYQYNYSTKKYDYVGKTKSTKYTIKKLKTGTIYKFRVRAYKTVDGVQYFGSYASTIKTATKPNNPKLKSISTKNKKVTLKWKSSTGATAYQVYMSTSKYGKYTKIKTTTSTKFTTSALKKGKRYYFKVSAYKKVNGKKIYTSFSNIYNIKVK